MWFFERRKRRKVKGGIRASSKRGAIGTTWWAKRWIEVLESFDIGARLARGKTYARQGQVRSIEIEKGEVTAEVQGSRPDPYDVTINVKTLTDAEWEKVTDVLSGQAIFLAKLLAGEMPLDAIGELRDEAFQAAAATDDPPSAPDVHPADMSTATAPTTCAWRTPPIMPRPPSDRVAPPSAAYRGPPHDPGLPRTPPRATR